MRVTRRYRFSASHRLHAPGLDASENRRMYGKCNNPFGHGHNYELEVSAGGPVDDTGRVLDVRQLDALVGEHVIARFAHRNLNVECPEFRDLVPTSENLGIAIVRRLKHNWRAAFPHGSPRLEKICIAETGHNIFEVFADEIE